MGGSVIVMLPYLFWREEGRDTLLYADLVGSLVAIDGGIIFMPAYLLYMENHE